MAASSEPTAAQVRALFILLYEPIAYTKQRQPSGKVTKEKLPGGVTVGTLYALRSNGWASVSRAGNIVTWSITDRGAEVLGGKNNVGV